MIKKTYFLFVSWMQQAQKMIKEIKTEIKKYHSTKIEQGSNAKARP